MLRYPGGKMRLMVRINDMIEDRYPNSDNWIVGEPFTGGGGSLINMAEHFPSWKFHINDANKDMFIFWRFMINASELEMGIFYRMLEYTKPTVEFYNSMFDSHPRNDLEIAFRIFFLNKTSFGGYVTKKLPIGGQAQGKKWNVDFYWKKPANLIKAIKRARTALVGRVLSVSNIDCNKFLHEHSGNLDFLYADPPYIAYGKQWYNCKFGMKELVLFRDGIDKFPRWCISMDSLEQTDTLFKKDEVKKIPIKHTAKSKNKKIKESKELLVFPRI